jgi:hypothetical protein
VNDNATLGTGGLTLGNSGGFTAAASKVLTANNSLTLAGTDATTHTFPTTSATIARTDAAQTFTGDQTLATGNLIVSNGKGIDFSATSSGSGTMTSELLADYEEGTWTPNQGVGLTVIGAFSSSGTYTKIGRQVTITGTVAGATSVAIAAGGAICTNCPFTGSGNYAGSIFNVQTGTTGTQVWQQTGTVYNVATLGAATSYVFTVTYFV